MCVCLDLERCDLPQVKPALQRGCYDRTDKGAHQTS